MLIKKESLCKEALFFVILPEAISRSIWGTYSNILISDRLDTLPSTLPDHKKISFPSDRSLGELYLVDADGRNQFVCEAQGEVQVPQGRQVSLYYSFDQSIGLNPLSGLKPDDIYAISLLGSDVGDREMPVLAHLTGLKELDISCTSVGDEGARSLANLTQLSKLNLSSTKIGDTGVGSLAGLEQLEELVLDDTQIGDPVLDLISRLSQLKTLSLSFTHTTNKGLAKLKALKSLERLRLNCTKIDDQGLTHICRLSSLKELWLRSTEVTYPGLVELTKWLADCEIIR